MMDPCENYEEDAMSSSSQMILQRIIGALEVDEDLIDSQLSQLSQPRSFSQAAPNDDAIVRPRGVQGIVPGVYDISGMRLPNQVSPREGFDDNEDEFEEEDEKQQSFAENIFSQDTTILCGLPLSEYSAFEETSSSNSTLAAPTLSSELRWERPAGRGPLSCADRERLIATLIRSDRSKKTTAACLRRILDTFASPAFTTELLSLVKAGNDQCCTEYVCASLGTDFKIPATPNDPASKDSEHLIWSCLLASLERCPELEAIVGPDYTIEEVQGKYNGLFRSHIMKYRQKPDFQLDLSLDPDNEEWVSIARSATLLRLFCCIVSPCRQKIKFLRTVSDLGGQRYKNYTPGGEAADHTVRMSILYETEGQSKAGAKGKSLKPVARNSQACTPRNASCSVGGVVFKQRLDREPRSLLKHVSSKADIGGSSSSGSSSSSSSDNSSSSITTVGGALVGQTPSGRKKSPPQAQQVSRISSSGATHRKVTRMGSTCDIPVEEQLKTFFTVPFRRLQAETQVMVLKGMMSLITGDHSNQFDENAAENGSTSHHASLPPSPKRRRLEGFLELHNLQIAPAAPVRGSLPRNLRRCAVASEASLLASATHVHAVTASIPNPNSNPNSVYAVTASAPEGSTMHVFGEKEDEYEYAGTYDWGEIYGLNSHSGDGDSNLLPSFLDWSE